MSHPQPEQRQATQPTDQAPRAAVLHLSRPGPIDDTAGVTRLDDGDLIEIHGRVAPSCTSAGIAAQVESVLTALHDLLARQGLGLDDVVTERWFLSDLASQYDAVAAARAAAYGGPAPAATWLDQAPCAAGRHLELQVYALRARSGSYRVAPVDDLQPPASGRLVTGPEVTHLHLQNLTGCSGRGQDTGFRTQCHRLFAALRSLLDTHGLTPEALVRTWIYLGDMAADYDDLNAIRNDCYRAWGVERLPASTGIGGGTHPPGSRLSADALCVWGPGVRGIDTMHAATLGEATAYGSAFSRGLRLQRPDRTVLYLSGTASIDTAGQVVHVGDIEGQCHRMFDNVEALLAAQGACLGRTLSAVTYLKDRAFLPVFEAVCRARGLPHDLLNTVVVADVCRPEWLCEIELTAVLPACPQHR